MLEIGLHAQTPGIATVANSAWLSPIASPGDVVSIHGSRFGSSVSAPTVTAGRLGAAVLLASDQQINVQFPFELPVGPTTLRVTVQGKVSESVGITVSAHAPAVFTVDGSGTGRGVFPHRQGLATPISSVAPVETVTVYMVGLGATGPHVPIGMVRPSALTVAEALLAVNHDVEASIRLVPYDQMAGKSLIDLPAASGCTGGQDQGINVNQPGVQAWFLRGDAE